MIIKYDKKHREYRRFRNNFLSLFHRHEIIISISSNYSGILTQIAWCLRPFCQCPLLLIWFLSAVPPLNQDHHITSISISIYSIIWSYCTIVVVMHHASVILAETTETSESCLLCSTSQHPPTIPSPASTYLQGGC